MVNDERTSARRNTAASPSRLPEIYVNCDRKLTQFLRDLPEFTTEKLGSSLSATAGNGSLYGESPEKEAATARRCSGKRRDTHEAEGELEATGTSPEYNRDKFSRECIEHMP